MTGVSWRPPPSAPAGWARPVATGRPGAGGGGCRPGARGAGRALGGGGRRRPVKVTNSRERRPGEPSSGGRILFSNHSRWGFFTQFGEFSSLAKFVGGSQEVASPFG